MMDYKFNEDNLISEFKEYVDNTYGAHYATDKFQATDIIMDAGHGDGFCVGNILKYGMRYGKKGTIKEQRKDLMKVMHYALLQLYLHDKKHNETIEFDFIEEADTIINIDDVLSTITVSANND